MLKIFEQIFRGETKSAHGYPDELIKRAIERALDATDPRVRILSAYAKQMRPAVIHVIDHVVQLVDALAAPVPMSRADWVAQPMMGAMFSSGESLQNAIARDATCKDFVAANAPIVQPITALLIAQYSQKHTFGYDQIGDKTVSDVPLTVVSFDEHRLLALATNEVETRRILKRRAFDYLLVLALAKITSVKEQRQDLVMRRKLLQTKLNILDSSSGNLSMEPRAVDKQSLQEKMDHVETQLIEMGADDNVLQSHLDLIIDMLGTAEKQLWLESQTLYLDNMHYSRAANHAKATALPVQLLRDNAHELALQLVVIPPASFTGG